MQANMFFRWKINEFQHQLQVQAQLKPLDLCWRCTALTRHYFRRASKYYIHLCWLQWLAVIAMRCLQFSCFKLWSWTATFFFISGGWISSFKFEIWTFNVSCKENCSERPPIMSWKNYEQKSLEDINTSKKDLIEKCQPFRSGVVSQ